MNSNPTQNGASDPRGNLLRLSERREVAIYLRNGSVWVADFQDGRGELFTVGAWFSLNRGGSVLRRRDLDVITPLPEDVVGRIERLHRRANASSEIPAALSALVAAAARLRGKLAGLFRLVFAQRPVDPLDSAALIGTASRFRWGPI